MTEKELFKALEKDVSFVAGMNQRYHQRLVRYWANWDRGIRIGVGLLAVGGVISLPYETVSWFVAIAAAVAAIVLNVVPVGDWNRTHLDLFRRWSDLRQDADGLMVKMNPNSAKPAQAVLVERLKELISKRVAINADEPAPSQKWLEEAFQREHRSRTGFKTPADKTTAQKFEAADEERATPDATVAKA